MMKIVVAGNFAQAIYWTKQFGWERKDWRYLASSEMLNGLPTGTEIHLVGEYCKHPSRNNSLFKWRYKELMLWGKLIEVFHDPDTGLVLL